ncbi:MAG: response regulator [Anaerolineae bacterium]|nr:response regulator [Anaerolineae bacterium]
MTKVLSGSPVARRSVFILADGSFVVQWDEHRVQDLLSARYRTYDDKDFGHFITDYELNQLKAAGLVEQYDRQYVWLFALPEKGRYPYDREYHSHGRVRSFYLNTTLPESRMAEVEAALQSNHLDGDFLARVRGSLIAILARNGAPFRQLKDAERAQKLLFTKAAGLFQNTAIAFVESSENPYSHVTEHTWGDIDLDTIVRSQTDTSVTAGRTVLVVIGEVEEQAAMQGLFDSMQMDVLIAGTVADGLQLLEDHYPDLLVMDLKLPDKYGWEMLAKIKEIGTFEHMPKIMIADHQSTPDDQAFALTVGKVDVYLVKPISMAQLRQNVWLTLQSHQNPAE